MTIINLEKNVQTVTDLKYPAILANQIAFTEEWKKRVQSECEIGLCEKIHGVGQTSPVDLDIKIGALLEKEK